MVKVTFVQANGEHKVVEAEIGKSLMEAAVKNGVAGVPADCGGACSCATCHCYIDLNFLNDLTPASADEIDMLEFAEEVKENSRLTCQIKVKESHDGMTIMVP